MPSKVIDVTELVIKLFDWWAIDVTSGKGIDRVGPKAPCAISYERPEGVHDEPRIMSGFTPWTVEEYLQSRSDYEAARKIAIDTHEFSWLTFTTQIRSPRRYIGQRSGLHAVSLYEQAVGLHLGLEAVLVAKNGQLTRT